MKKDGSGAAYLIKFVHVIGQQIDNLACSGLTQGHVTEAKRLEYRERENYILTLISSHT